MKKALLPLLVLPFVLLSCGDNLNGQQPVDPITFLDGVKDEGLLKRPESAVEKWSISVVSKNLEAFGEQEINDKDKGTVKYIIEDVGFTSDPSPIPDEVFRPEQFTLRDAQMLAEQMMEGASSIATFYLNPIRVTLTRIESFEQNNNGGEKRIVTYDLTYDKNQWVTKFDMVDVYTTWRVEDGAIATVTEHRTATFKYTY